MKTVFNLIIYFAFIVVALTIKMPDIFYFFIFSVVLLLFLNRKSLKLIFNPKFLMFAFLFICVIPLVLGDKDKSFLGIFYSHYYFNLSSLLVLRGSLMIISVTFLVRNIDVNIIIDKLAGKKGVMPVLTVNSLKILTLVNKEVISTYYAFTKKHGKLSIYLHPVKFLSHIFINLDLMTSRIKLESEKNTEIQQKVPDSFS